MRRRTSKTSVEWIVAGWIEGGYVQPCGIDILYACFVFLDYMVHVDSLERSHSTIKIEILMF